MSCCCSACVGGDHRRIVFLLLLLHCWDAERMVVEGWAWWHLPWRFAVCRDVGIGEEEEKANIKERGRESRPGSVGWSVGA